jgi:zinc protease
MTAKAIDIPHEQYQLENGLNVILHHDDSLPQVVVNLWYGVGSKDEEMGRSGFAHLFEHLMFMGTVNLPGSGFDERMEAYGGWNNAWTSTDATDYYEAGPSNLLETFLWMESDRMRDLARAMTQEKLDLQRDVVRNERRQSVEDTPYGIIWEAMSPALYPEDHPYGHTVIGTHEDLQAATVDDVVRFFNTWYVPNNASLVVAGDFDTGQARQWIDTYFGSIPQGSLPERSKPEPRVGPQKAVVETTDNVQIPLTLIAWHTAAAFEPGDAALDVLASILGEGRSSRLYADLVTEKGQALEVSAWQYSQLLSGIFAVSGKPAEGVTVEELETSLQAHLQTIADEGPTAEELERVRNQLEVQFISQLEGLDQRASALNRYHFLTGNPDYADEDLQRYRNLSAEDIKKAAASLTQGNSCILRVRPESGGEK